MENISESELDWDTLEVVIGRLVGINRSEETITLEFRGAELNDPITETYTVTLDFDDEHFNRVSRFIGNIVQAILEDGEVKSIRPV